MNRSEITGVALERQTFGNLNKISQLCYAFAEKL